MKSLCESLFDNELVEKVITFGDLYDLDHFYFSGSNNGYYAFDIFMISRLKHDFKIPDFDLKKYFTSVLKGFKYDQSIGGKPDKQSKNRPYITNVLYYIITNFDMSTDYSEDIKRWAKFYGPDKNINDLLSRLCTYFRRKLSAYIYGNGSLYVNASYDNSGNIKIMIGKWQSRGVNQFITFVFRKK